MNQPPLNRDDVEARRKRARRTALWVALAAVVVYVTFIAVNVLGR